MPNSDEHDLVIDTPWGKKRWGFLWLCMVTHEDLLEALRRALDHAESGDDYDWIGAAQTAVEKTDALAAATAPKGDPRP